MARQPTIVERFIAELVGTFLLVFVGGGAASVVAIIGQHTKHTTTYADVLTVALAHGLILFIIVMVVGRISGAHVNPAITLGLASVGRFPWEEVIPYLLAQLIGAIIGAAAILIVYGAQAATIGHLGGPSLATNTNLFQGFFAEALGAFILVIAVIATAADTRSPAGWAGLTIGLALGAAIIFIGPATGATVNPARALGPDLVAFVFYQVHFDVVAYLVCYLLGPIVGGVGACFLYQYISRMPRPKTTR
ncbi:MAG TPA: aquaporin [Ktedonobacterales bacterium]|nr:aquaporin [Ktedonobacterales bacterium]